MRAYTELRLRDPAYGAQLITTSSLDSVEPTPDLQPQGKALYLEADPVHFNARGNQIIARRLLETVTNLANP